MSFSYNDSIRAGMVLYWLLWALVLAGLGMFLYTRRPSESAGKAVAFARPAAVLKYIAVILCTLAGGVLFRVIGVGLGWQIFGFFCGGIKASFFRKEYSEKKVAATRRLINKAAGVLKYFTFMLLLIGLLWCVYFLVLAVVQPEQVDYANNMAELIVAGLTVISILFAFVEFIRGKGDKKE